MRRSLLGTSPFLGMLLFNFHLGNGYCSEEKIFTLQEVRITAQAETLPWERLPQEVTVITQPFLERGANLHSAVDLRKRGSFGVQEDLTIRGTNFEQNLLLIEGLRVSDLQTAHHLLNLPVQNSNLQAIEVLTGGASASYGAAGFGGALNFLLEKPVPERLSVSLNLGSYDYQDYTLTLNKAIQGIPLGLNVEQKKSNGFIWNRDFALRLFNLYSKDKAGTIFYGYVEKDFGARNFYTPKFDTEWEETRTHLFLAKRLFPLGSLSFEPGFVTRINYDHYLLDRAHPSFYQNKHRTKLYRLNLPVIFKSRSTYCTLGLEGSYETLDSTRLGELLRRSLSLYSDLNLGLSPDLFLDLKGRYDLYLKERDFLSLGGGLSYLLTKQVKLRGQANLSYRLPSATELRYNAIGIKGNPKLMAEEALNVEAGLDYVLSRGMFSLSLYSRKGSNLIDWITNATGTYAENIAVSTFGGTLHLTYEHPLAILLLSYTYTKLRGDKIKLSRYHGAYLRHNLQLGLKKNLPLATKLTLYLNPQKRFQQGEVYLLNLVLEKRLSPFTIKLWVENLLDERYFEVYYPLAKKGVRGQPQTLGLSLLAEF